MASIKPARAGGLRNRRDGYHYLVDPFECRFAPRPQTVPTARHAMGRWLEHHDLRPETRGDVLLVVSELVSNGVIHDGGDDLILRAWADDAGILIEVVSRAASVSGPDPRGYESADFGRGLAIVNHLGEHSVVSHGARRVDRCCIPA